MRHPLVRFTVRRMMVNATIYVATFGGFTHVVMSQSIGIELVETDDQKKARAAVPDEARRRRSRSIIRGGSAFGHPSLAKPVAITTTSP